ncbi:MAG: DUF4115 domain-containing protein [Deltaproteobacteria bacterium]|nr:DUF4115 domain-containing protein [Deltaproteobacteria bacterium]
MNQTKHHKPSEQDSLQAMAPSPKNGEELPSAMTIGAFLRDEREKKGLSYDQVSELTRLRPPILEALENESWDSLSSPAFASGFVRSYGRALGLEEQKVMALLKEARPTADSAPKPLMEPVSNKKTFLVILIFVLLALIPAYFFWKGYSTHKKVLVNRGPIRQAEKKPEKIQDNHKRTALVNSTEKLKLDPTHETDPETGVIKHTNNLPAQDETSTNDFASVAAFDGMTAPELTLKAGFREMTWLRIFVDDQDSREYIFRPGEHFEWKAKKGFEVLIGNAAGIDLEFNGEGVESFGTPGQVVRLMLPKDHERRRQQD